MELSQAFPLWDKLTADQQQLLQGTAVLRNASKGTLLHNGSADCVGLFLICQGQLRAFILSDEGKEVTLYRLFARDFCLFSASCMMRSLQFDVMIEAEKDAEFWVIPADVYKRLMDTSLAVAGYTNELMATRMSDVMWLVEQVLFKRFDQRLAGFLLEESALDGGDTLEITHDRIASHLGTAREVVTRMLRYFQSEDLVSLSRGAITLQNRSALRKMADT